MVHASVSALVFFLCAAIEAQTKNAPPEIDAYYATKTGIIYAISRGNGFLFSKDNGLSWEKRNTGLPAKVVYPFDDPSIRSLTSLAVDGSSENRVAVTTADGLYVSENSGETWEAIPVVEPIKPSAYLTASALSPVSRDTFLLGTSFSGLFETRNRGKTWIDLNDHLKEIYRGAGFYEEISGVAYSLQNPPGIFMACGFGQGLFLLIPGGKKWRRVDFPGDKQEEYIRNLSTKRGNDNSWLLYAETDTYSYSYNQNTGVWNREPFPFNKEEKLDPAKIARLLKASNKYGIYLAASSAGRGNLEQHIKFLKNNNFNSVVVDMKDDTGMITYNSGLPIGKEVGSISAKIDIDELIQKAHVNGIYVVGRIVVFQDRVLYTYKDNTYAVWDNKKKEPWGNYFKVENGENGKTAYEQREYWVDPYAQFVWEYNIAIARELQEKGIDEIQFDYIRFPSDGDFTDVCYRYKKDGMTKIDALESFLKMARENISIPISSDLYGFNSWFRMGNWIGQSIEIVSFYADA
ncbi:MAG: putative glycoside hydrolase, partial [Spirochaetota bacterium]